MLHENESHPVPSTTPEGTPKKTAKSVKKTVSKKPQPECRSLFDVPTLLKSLNASERATLILYAVHNLLLQEHQESFAKLVWAAYLGTSEVTEALSDALDVECILP